MAAYAAVVSLMNTIDDIHNHPLLSTSLGDNQVKSLGGMLDFFLDFIESGGSKQAADLERRIATAAHEVEDVIESHIVQRHLIINNLDEIRSRRMNLRRAIRSSISDQRCQHFQDHPLIHRRSSSGWSLPRLFGQMTVASVRASLKGLRDIFQNFREKMRSKGGFAVKTAIFIDLQLIIKKMDSVKKAIGVYMESGLRNKQPKHPIRAALSRNPTSTGKTTMVGFDSYVIQLLDWLTGEQSDRQIIPITGMAGIGKSTLTRVVYEHPLISHHFEHRAWVTVSQEYNASEILKEILSCVGECTSLLDKETEDELGGHLHKILFGRRYVIILDDIWTLEAWDKISRFFPENGNGSRIVVTTRISKLVNHFGSLGLEMNFLNDADSWRLFCDKAFAQEDCPDELENIGKKIVNKCGGLPLSIVVIGGLLGTSSREQHWEKVASDVSSFLNSGVENQCVDILSLSYDHLPACLKPCFLHLGVFSEDCDVTVSLIVKLWVAEGFLRPNKDQSLEEVGEDYIEDLVDRNLVLVRILKLNGKTKTCTVHDLVRDMCLRISQKEKLFCVMRSPLQDPRGLDEQRRIIIHGSTGVVPYAPTSTSCLRSLICKTPTKLSLKPGLLRVLIAGDSFSTGAAFSQVNLRFLSSSHELGCSTESYKLPSSLSLLWNVQTLIMTKGTPWVDAPSIIWEMPLLRHLKFQQIKLPNLPTAGKSYFLPKLQTLKTVLGLENADMICRRMPNIKKLRTLYLRYEGENLENVGNLNKLESLKCSSHYPSEHNLLRSISFPSSLKKFTLDNFRLEWNQLSMIGLLPHIEFLKLCNVVAKGTEWNPVEGEFPRLQFLGIYGCPYLICWNADNSHFPVLKKLVLERVWKLDEIPLEIGEIATLEHISVYDCSISAAVSAVKIREEQESLENHGLQVIIHFSTSYEQLEFSRMLEELEL